MNIEEAKLKIEDRIFTIRGKQVMLDRDLSQLYQVEVSQMNRQVKRNIERFPTDFMFQLTKEEHEYLKCQNGITNTRGGDRMLPYAFNHIAIYTCFHLPHLQYRRERSGNEFIDGCAIC